MSYLYHVSLSRSAPGHKPQQSEACIELPDPLEFESDLDALRHVCRARYPGDSVTINNWTLLRGKRRMADHARVTVDHVLGTDGEPFDLMQLRTTWFPLRSPARRRNTLFPPLPRPQTAQEWADLVRDMPARFTWPGRSDESGLDALAAGLRYSPELQARGASMNATLLDSLDMVRTALDRASVREFAADTVEHLAQFVELGLVPEAAVKYLKTLASAVRQADARHLVEAAQ